MGGRSRSYVCSKYGKPSKQASNTRFRDSRKVRAYRMFHMWHHIILPRPNGGSVAEKGSSSNIGGVCMMIWLTVLSFPAHVVIFMSWTPIQCNCPVYLTLINVLPSDIFLSFSSILPARSLFYSSPPSLHWPHYTLLSHQLSISPLLLLFALSSTLFSWKASFVS